MEIQIDDLVIIPSITRLKLSKIGFLLEHHAGCCPFGCCVSKKAIVNWLNRHPNNSKRKTLRTFRDGSRKH